MINVQIVFVKRMRKDKYAGKDQKIQKTDPRTHL